MTRSIVALVGVALFGPPAEAQISLDRFYPSTVGGSGETTITAEGKFPSWPCQVSCDRTDIKVAPAKESGKLTVTIAEPAPPGIAWVRLFDRQSASNLVPLMIETSAVTVEQEPNNQLTEASELELPAIVTGRLHRSGEVDGFRVSVKSGDQLIASVVGNRILGSPMDAVLQIADMNGNVLAQSDDVLGLDPQLIYRVREDGDLVVRIFAFPTTPNSTIGFAGGNAYLYELSVTIGPFLDHVSPIMTAGSAVSGRPAGWNLPEVSELKLHQPSGISPAVWHSDSALGWQWSHSIDDQAVWLAESDDPASPVTAESLPIVFTGCISEARQIDRVRFRVSAGKKYVARSYSKSAGYLLDSVIRVIDVASGKEIVRKDDNSRTDFDSRAEFTAKSDAEYELQVLDAVDAFSIRHEYAVWFGEDTPRVRLSVAADHFTLPAGGTVEIPVTVSRSGGFDQKLTVTASGLPAGASVAAAVSEPKGETAKLVKLKISATDQVAFQGNIQIVASIAADQDAGSEPDRYVATFALRDAIELPDIWLTVSPKK